MLANVHFSAVQGIVAHPVEVEVNDGYGQTITVTVGLPEFKPVSYTHLTLPTILLV